MKKMIFVLFVILTSVSVNAQFRSPNYEKNRLKSFENLDKRKNFFYPCMNIGIGYSHSIIHSNNNEFSFNNINEIWFNLWFLEYAYYWDNTEYSNNEHSFNERINDKSYITHNISESEYGYSGFKFGYKAEYFSFGFVMSFGQDKYNGETENVHLNYIKCHYNTYSGGFYSSGLGFGIYVKAHYEFEFIEPFISAQFTNNNDNYVSFGINLVFNFKNIF